MIEGAGRGNSLVHIHKADDLVRVGVGCMFANAQEVVGVDDLDPLAEVVDHEIALVGEQHELDGFDFVGLLLYFSKSMPHSHVFHAVVNSLHQSLASHLVDFELHPLDFVPSFVFTRPDFLQIGFRLLGEVVA